MTGLLSETPPLMNVLLPSASLPYCIGAGCFAFQGRRLPTSSSARPAHGNCVVYGTVFLADRRTGTVSTWRKGPTGSVDLGSDVRQVVRDGDRVLALVRQGTGLDPRGAYSGVDGFVTALDASLQVTWSTAVGRLPVPLAPGESGR